MNRQSLFNFHFYLASFFTPFLLLMAFTGTFYLFGNKGKLKETLVRSNVIIQDEQKNEQVKKLVKELDANYNYESLKDRGDLFKHVQRLENISTSRKMLMVHSIFIKLNQVFS